MTGRKTWFFPDAELPPPGDGELKGHESVIILNPNTEPAVVAITLYWTTGAPDRFTVDVDAEAVRCLRTNVLSNMGGIEIPLEVQYAIGLSSNVGVVAQYGRLDVRPGLAFYSTPGYWE